MFEKRKILFICGSLNQTSMLHQISQFFPEYDRFFTPYYFGDLREHLTKIFFNNTILGGKYKKHTMEYLEKSQCAIDIYGLNNKYSFIFTCQDIIIQNNIKDRKIFLVQEGMTDPEKIRYLLVKKLGFPRYIAGSSVTGLSDAYELFFVASQGYKELFIHKGVKPEKIRVTGIPNFDFVDQYRKNPFPYKHYVLVATSNLRESLEYENRKKFILKARKIAQNNNKKLIFKLHPSEKVERATREINKYAPEAMVFPDGNTNHMIANCDILVTRYSSVVYTALALGKEVYADIPLETLNQLKPIQNKGTSAKSIAEITKDYLDKQDKEFRIYHQNFRYRSYQES